MTEQSLMFFFHLNRLKTQFKYTIKIETNGNKTYYKNNLLKIKCRMKLYENKNTC